MHRTRITTLVLVALVTTIAGWVVIRFAQGRGAQVPTVPWLVDVAIGLLAAAVLRWGWTVRAYQQGKRPSLDPLRAARICALAKAAALTGALLAGWYFAQVLVLVGDWSIESLRAKAIAAVIAVVAAIGLSVAGLVAELFCRLPPPGPGEGADARDEEGASGAPS